MPNAHTPGPWIADSWYVGPKDLPTLVKVNPNGPLGHEEVIANARLIAAAPDLLAALQSALSDAKPAAHREYWRDGADGESSELVREETWPDWIAAARAAIAQATGA